MSSVDEFVNSPAWLAKVSGAQRGRERHAAPAADAHGSRLAARAQPPRPPPPLPLPPRTTDAMELADVPRHRPLAFDKIECGIILIPLLSVAHHRQLLTSVSPSPLQTTLDTLAERLQVHIDLKDTNDMESLIKEMQDPETGVPVRSQKLFLSVIPSAFMGYDLVEWLMERFNLDETSNVEAINLANQLCQYGYFFPVNDLKNLVLKDDSSLYRFQSPYYWPWQAPRVAGGSSAPTLGPDNVEYAIYLVKRTLRNKQRHGLEEYEQEALTNLKKNLAAKWDFITMQAEEQVRLAKDRKKGDKIVSDSQERAYWRVARPPPGVSSALEPCPVPVRARHHKPKKRTLHHLTREIEHLKTSLDRTRVKTSIALEALLAYSETFAPYDPWLTPPQPSNPWVSEDTLFWQINSPLVEVPSEKRVQRWALSIEELLSDPTGLHEFTNFLRKEYSHENIRFWLAVMDLRRSSTKQIPKKLEEIYEEFLKPGAPCEINIDGATADRVSEGLRSGSRYALDHAADHVYGLLLKKDCYPRFVRSEYFQKLLADGKNVHQKKAKFFNFGGQVKKKPGSSGVGCSAGGSGAAAMARRRGSDRSLSGSAHELALCAVQPPRAPDPPAHSHSQSNLTDIPFRDPLDDDTADVLPWECSSRDGAYGGGGGAGAGRRRQDSAADSGSSSSDVSAAVCVAERTRRLPQQSTLDGGLRGAPPPLRRLSAVEPRHLAPLTSPPHSPRPPRPVHHPRPAPHVPPHPTPTISVSSAPDDESAGSPPGTCSPVEPRSVAHSDEPSSVFASADATPTESARTPLRPPDGLTSPPELVYETAGGVAPPTDAQGRLAEESCDESIASCAASDSKGSDRTRSSEDDFGSVRWTLSREASMVKDPEPVSDKIAGDDSGAVAVSTRVSERDEIPDAVQAPEELEDGTGSERSEQRTRPPVAPLAECEELGVEDDNVEKVPSAPTQRVSGDSRAASETDATKNIAHRHELMSVSESDTVNRDSNGGIGACKQRNDVCPWEDENSCESDAPFVKTYATLGYL